MRPLRPLLAVLATLIPALLPHPTMAAATPRPGGPSLVIQETESAATTDFRWGVTLQFRNDTPQGVYTDSLTCEAQDLDPGVTHGPRTRMIEIGFVKRQIPSLGTQERTAMAFSYTALYENARLVFRYYTHDQDQRRYVAADTITMRPALFGQQNPSVSLRVDGTDIEYYYVRGLGGDASAPAILLIHDDQSHARHLIPLASDLSDKGYNVMAISQPGYGRSGGEPDLMGPATLKAVETALAALRRTRGVDSTRVVVWGVGRGGTLAARLAMTHPELAGAIATRGMYDLQAVARGSRKVRERFASEAGRDSAAWAARSPASQPAKLAAPLLIEYTASDAEVPPAQAQAFAAALGAAGQPVEIQEVDGADRPLPSGGARDEAYAFLERRFKR